MRANCGLSSFCLLLIILLQSHHAAAELCRVKDCVRCGPYFAECATSDPYNAIPHDLESTIQNLIIYYEGPNIDLNNGSFRRFSNLTTLFLSGDFQTINNLAFDGFPNLTSLTIYSSTLSRIDNNVFGTTSALQHLNLTDTDLTTIPTNIFHSLTKLQVLGLSNNLAMMVCTKDMTSIGKEFKSLISLQKLVLDRLGQSTPCYSITADYFEPVAHVTDIRLSHTGFFAAGPTVLNRLTKLQNLSMSNVSPFKECPREAKQLFDNLPRTLVSLKAHDWKTSFAMNQSCTINEDTLSGLKKLPNLKSIGFRYSDKVFGEAISETLFKNFSALETLDLGWCSFNNIATGAFKGLNILDLRLNMNQLGSREFWPFGPDNQNLTSTVKRLDISHCGIVALHYYAFFIAKTFPNLEFLDLSNNMLQHLPNFHQKDKITPISDIRRLHLERNSIRELSGDHMNNICNIMPKLQSLSAYNNHISNLSDLCISLRYLSLDHNLLWKNADSNFKAISLLRNLEYLDLDTNNLTFIRNHTFDHMPNLNTLILSANNLKHIDDQAFIHNYNLATLLLQANKFSVFNVTLLEGPKNLRKLCISTNLITHFDSAFVKFMDDRQDNGTLQTVKIANNPFDCSCGRKFFSDWLNRTKLVHESVGLECTTPENMAQKKVYNYQEDLFECTIKVPLIWSAVVLCLIIVTIIIAVPCYRYRWYIFHMVIVMQAVKDRAMDIKHSDECKYDAMILSDNDSEADMKFVKTLLLHLEGGVFPALDSMSEADESERSNRLYHSLRDAIPGTYRFESLCEVMRQSRKIIIVISNSYLNSSECMSEAAFAGEELFGTKVYKPEKIVVLVLEDLNEDLMQSPSIAGLLTETVIDLPESKRQSKKTMAPVWDRLKKFVENKPNSYIFRKRNISRNASRNGYESI